ncbi:sigma-70 family RNA polymerase sigma factor [Frankia sp. Ag45/Mut15]|uniref:Sigma-70 family RNA polymerase sigma factor n=1 Tax=Frankia umida TaxID=573489 RepID=A0ABT0K224_9ACTN|nr:sigma-70 family RNA polymerase sigma factor [Frankia umida]MCK9877847.1 sigma-70 family RNA polymerase sigma factor [Frankia umida]
MDNRTFAGSKPASPAPRRTSPALHSWMQDWSDWSQSNPADRAVDRWRAASSLIAPLADLEQILAGCGTGSQVEAGLADRRLLFLVTAAVDGDVDAARVVMARMMPALVSKAAAHSRAGRMDFDTAFTELIAAAWIVVTTYPVERRPAKVWINVLLDAEQAVFGRPRLAHRRTVPMPFTLLADQTDPLIFIGRDPLVELLDLLVAARRAGLTPGNLQLLVDLGVHGLSPQEIAVRDRVTDRAVRMRRQRAIVELVTLLDLPSPHRTTRTTITTPRQAATPAARGDRILAGAV